MPSIPTNPQEREAIFRQAEKVGHIGSWYSEIGLEDEKLVWSEETYRIFGQTPDTFGEKVSDWLKAVHPDDRDAVIKASRAAVDHGVPYSIDHRIVRPDGAIRWVHEQAEVVRDDQGKALRMLGVVQDITEAKHIQEKLRESEAQYRSIFDYSLEAIFILSEDAKIMTANQAAAELTGWRVDELIGKMVTDTYLPQERPMFQQRLEQFRIKHKLHIERALLRKDSSTIFVEIFVTLLPNKQILQFAREMRDSSRI